MGIPEITIIAIACHTDQGLICRNLCGQLKPATKVPGMPYLIDRSEEGAKLFTEHAVGI
jgi:hypothetical protein